MDYDPKTERYALTPEQEFALAAPDGLSLPGGFLVATSTIKDEPKITEAFRTGGGVSGTSTTRICSGAPSASSVQATQRTSSAHGSRRCAGARVADVGCGHGSSTILMAQAYPASTFVGFDYHAASIQAASKAAAAAGVAGRVTFEVVSASE